jgi:glyoxylase-like metal-dependent hydrolase (beta-lactamase superfamily II)
VEQYGAVTRLRMRSAGGRLAGLDVSAYVVRGVLVDTGFHHARRALDAAVRERSLRGAIVTHWHEDHAGNVELLARRGLPLLVRGDTELVLRSRPMIRLYRRVVWGHPPRLEAPVAPFAVDDLQVIHTPGHSTDHQVVWDPQSGTLFSGDLWLGVRASVLHEAEDPFVIADSLRSVMALQPARMFDAHRGLVPGATAALRAKLDWLTTTTGEIERRLERGWSEPTIVADLLGGDAPSAVVSRGEYSRRNFVRAVRRRIRG